MARRIFGIGRLASLGEPEDGSDDHLHRCPDGHTWIHAGASLSRASGVMLPLATRRTAQSARDGLTITVADVRGRVATRGRLRS